MNHSPQKAKLLGGSVNAEFSDAPAATRTKIRPGSSVTIYYRSIRRQMQKIRLG